ncbi:hypothetical protein VCR4J2_510089 [Vibrio coralliirubri]|nr:hypothetical protein VCR4J2_510089 [Vibrio coralliirubri]
MISKTSERVSFCAYPFLMLLLRVVDANLTKSFNHCDSFINYTFT